MRYIFIIPLLALILPLAACKHDGDSDDFSSLTFSTLTYADGSDVKGDASGITGKRLQVVRDNAEFSTLWSEHVAVFSPMPAQPTVDFNSQMVIAAFSGVRPSSGYEVTIGAVSEFSTFIDVLVHHQSPGEGCAVTTVATQPHHMVLVPASDKPIAFSEVFSEGDPC